ncbi:anthranilate phosphoribosyltransferase [candidate division KSB1 bacterium]
MIKECIKKATDRKNLTETEASLVMDEIMTGRTTPAQLASFITALMMKGETVEELIGFVRVMRDKVTKVRTCHKTLVDTCGTGGDKQDTFNVSTVSAFVAAGAGVIVAKHGNKAASSKCGSADLLMALDINIDAELNVVEKSLDEVGIGFLFAPNLHKAMKHAVGPRREIGIRTFFNIIGPLTNPAEAKRQLMGIFSAEWTEKIAHVMKSLDAEKAFVVNGLDGIDEISTVGETQISELKDGNVRTYTVIPEDFGFTRHSIDEISGGDVKESVESALSVFEGEKGAKRDMVLINTAAAIVTSGMVDKIEDGIELAEKSIDSGAALKKLEQLKEIYKQ